MCTIEPWSTSRAVTQGIGVRRRDRQPRSVPSAPGRPNPARHRRGRPALERGPARARDPEPVSGWRGLVGVADELTVRLVIGDEGLHVCRERHWITWSARCSNDDGMVSPSALAVLRLMTSSNFVGCSIGRSAGLAPLRIRST